MIIYRYITFTLFCGHTFSSRIVLLMLFCLQENEEEEDGIGAEEEPLCSDDDVSDEENQNELFDTDNVVVCQYDKVKIHLIQMYQTKFSHFFTLNKSNFILFISDYPIT